MKPITADNADGRTLLALRAGPMTAGELSARNGSGVAGWLIKAGYVTQDDSYYRLTEAGRAACPYRNPLAAPGVVQTATFKPEIDMSKQTVVTRQQVLAVITEAGPAGIKKKSLVGKFPMVHENAITSHLVMLKKDCAINNPSLGLWVAIPTVNLENKPKTESPAVVASDNVGAKQQLIDMAPAIDLKALQMPAEAVEIIEVKGIPDRRAPLALGVDDEIDFECGVYSDGTFNLVIDDGLQDAVIEFSPAAFKKLRTFLGLIQEVA